MKTREAGLARWARLLTLPALAHVATAAGAEFEPSVAVGVTYTDNIELTAADPQRATVYQLLPGFTFLQQGKRLRTNLDLGVEAYRYDELGENEVYQTFTGAVVAALDPDNFFFEIGAERDQVIRDPASAIPRTNLAISSNRLDRDDYHAMPTFQYPIGQNATVQGSYRRDRIRYNEGSGALLADELDADSFRISLDNYRRERGLSWAVRYNADQTDFRVFEPWEYRQAAVEIGGWATRRVRLFAAGGKESAWDQPLDPSLEDSYWEAGFANRPGGMVAVEIAAGERTFGSSRRASLDALFPHGRTHLEYSEQPTTLGRDAGRDLVLSELPGGLADFLSRPGAVERFVSKLFRWSLSFELRRLSASLSVYDESREQRTLLDGTPLDDETQRGIDLTATWRAGSRTDFRFGAQRAEVDLGLGERRLSGITVGAEYRLGRRTGLSMLLMRMEEDSGASPDPARDYRADLVTLQLRRTFGHHANVGAPR
jgi:uncharacterized protein (PEP-CTERM system associated)